MQNPALSPAPGGAFALCRVSCSECPALSVLRGAEHRPMVCEHLTAERPCCGRRGAGLLPVGKRERSAEILTFLLQ